MRLLKKINTIFFCFLAINSGAQKTMDKQFFNWKQASPIPDSIGFAGSYAGVSNNVLLVAGGANFPDGKKPWSNGVKTWYDRIFALEGINGQWKEAGKLPRQMGYGISLTYKDGVVCAGGGDALQNYADVFILRYRNGKIDTENLPSIPVPLINAGGVILNDILYIGGGIQTPAGLTTNDFYSLSLSASPAQRVWKKMPPIPGKSRMLFVAGAGVDKIYVFGGVHLYGSLPNTTPQREYLKDCWSYDAINGWKKLADLPNVLAAAPTPAYKAGQTHLVIFGGDDGAAASKVMELKDTHPGFRKEILAYNTITDSWSVTGSIPVDVKADAVINPNASVYAPVTTTLVTWNDLIIIPGGEARPATRTNRVLVAEPQQPEGKFGGLDWTIIALYFVAVVLISLYVSRQMGKTTGDFFLGGQKIPWWAAGLSIFGSKLSALTFIAIPAKAYATDWVYIMNNVMIVAIAPIVTFFYLPYFRKLKLTSVYEYLQIRFNTKVKLLGSFTFVVFQLSRLGVVIYLPALVLSTVTGINIFACIILTTLITTAYSVLGGIEAVIWT